MALYTIILDYRGGTYISQVRARSPRAAAKQWARALDVVGVKHLGAKGKQKIITNLENDEYCLNEPVALTGLVGVWCIGMPIPGGLVNIVATVDSDGAAQTKRSPTDVIVRHNEKRRL
jgi:hypothetical protein